jgi:uncharacterized repeat protein (TIGR03803 family)
VQRLRFFPLPVLNSWILIFAMACLGAVSASAQSELQVLHMFNGTDGENPSDNLIADKDGNLYGTTEYGGANGYYGTVFELSPPKDSSGRWKEATLYVFANGGDGARPTAGLVFGNTGNLYGTTSGINAGDYGNVFELSPPTVAGDPWTETVLYTFQGTASDGANPFGGLMFDPSGNLFGTTEDSAFELSPPAAKSGNWAFTQLHFFKCCTADGFAVYAGLVRDQLGNLYGTTEMGGFYDTNYCTTLGCGTVFEISPPAVAGGSWSERVLYRFKSNIGGYSDGLNPFSGLIFDPAGNLYGNTYGGGSLGGGIVFKLSPRENLDAPWKETILHNFDYSDDGAVPVGTLIFDNTGNLYGMTEYGGLSCIYNNESYGCGTIFELSPAADGSWTETILYEFSHKSFVPRDPGAGVLLDQAGNFYGTTVYGGITKCGESGSGCGTVFEFKP